MLSVQNMMMLKAELKERNLHIQIVVDHKADSVSMGVSANFPIANHVSRNTEHITLTFNLFDTPEYHSFR